MRFVGHVLFTESLPSYVTTDMLAGSLLNSVEVTIREG